MTDTTQVTVAEFRKNANEVWRVGTSTFAGHDMFFVRAFYDAGGGEYRPSKNGLNARIEQLPEIIAALQRIVESASE
jgi:hypothetical protein